MEIIRQIREELWKDTGVYEEDFHHCTWWYSFAVCLFPITYMVAYSASSGGLCLFFIRYVRYDRKRMEEIRQIREDILEVICLVSTRYVVVFYCDGILRITKTIRYVVGFGMVAVFISARLLQIRDGILFLIRNFTVTYAVVF